MTVYVESNFVLEQALQQEQCDACDEILNLAVSGAISLLVPAFSLADPHQALALKAKPRNKLSNELRAHFGAWTIQAIPWSSGRVYRARFRADSKCRAGAGWSASRHHGTAHDGGNYPT